MPHGKCHVRSIMVLHDVGMGIYGKLSEYGLMEAFFAFLQREYVLHDLLHNWRGTAQFGRYITIPPPKVEMGRDLIIISPNTMLVYVLCGQPMKCTFAQDIQN